MLVFSDSVLLVCATCFGDPNHPLTRGLNHGIASLLVVTVVVLTLFACFIVHLVRSERRAKVLKEK